MESAFYTVQEVAKLLSISRSFAYDLVRKGTIPSIKLNGRVRIPIAAFNDWLGSPGQEER